MAGRQCPIMETEYATVTLLLYCILVPSSAAPQGQVAAERGLEKKWLAVPDRVLLHR